MRHTHSFRYTAVLPLLIFVFLFSACRTQDSDLDPEIERGLLLNESLNIAGDERSYHVFVPEQSINAPIVLLFHGHSGSHDGLLGLGGETAPYKPWLTIAQQENLIVAVPKGLRISSDEKGWNDCREDAPTNSQADDVLFIHSLLDHLIDQYQADARRVYVNGTSNGGHMCIRLAFEMPERVTAFAAIVAAHVVNSACTDSDTPVSALFMNGTADPILPYTGGQMAADRGEAFSTEQTLEYWVNRNGTDIAPQKENLADIDLNDESTVEKYTYENGHDNTEVVLYKIVDGGHVEPSKTERISRLLLNILGNQNADIEMTEEVWAFFKDKSK